MKKKIFKTSLAFSAIGLGLLLTQINKPAINEETKIIFFGLGKADSIYIENNNQKMLIDTGLKDHRALLIDKLEALKVEKLDYLVLTHPDKDHIGSASYIMERFEIGELIQSTHHKGTKREKRIEKVIKQKQIKNHLLTEDRRLILGNLEINLLAPSKEFYEKDNDYSIVTLVQDGSFNYLFAGDAEKALLDEVLTRELPAIDLYKVPHHGRENANTVSMIEKIKPKNSVITNYYQAVEIADILKDKNSKIFYTAHEDLTVINDGEKLTFK